MPQGSLKDLFAWFSFDLFDLPGDCIISKNNYEEVKVLLDSQLFPIPLWTFRVYTIFKPEHGPQR
jgi:hypothetical protein